MFRGLKKRLASGTSGPRESGPPTSQQGSGHADSMSSFQRSMRMYRAAKYDVALLKSRVLNLVSFDACVEAADSLASQPPDALQDQSSSLSRKQHPSGLTDACVLVSVDGNLLLIPPLEDPSSIFHTKPNTDPDPSELAQSVGSNSSDSPMFSKLMADGKDDYASAVYLGSDIDGDKKLNGFSAMGWSLPASSHALAQSEASLHNLLSFSETIVQSRKEAAAKIGHACLALRQYMPSLGGSHPLPMARSSKTSTFSRSRSNSDDWEIVDPRANEFVPNAVSRTGPFVAPDSTLNQALVLIEDYFAKSSQVESDFWHNVSSGNDSLLPKLHEAFFRVSDRVQQREEALEEASQRARLLEERLQGLRKEAEQKWAKVYRTEEKAQAKLEALWMERSRQREKARLDKLHEEGETSQASAPPSTADIMSLVAQVSEDGGSFEPIELDATAAGLGQNRNRDSVAANSLPDADPRTESFRTISGGSSISRDHVEENLKLNELRASAVAVDEQVEDAAQDLLVALANLDFTRRAARVVAETALVNAGNAQVQCIREFAAMERKAIEQRLTLVERLEKNLNACETNTRQDIDSYITRDKKERGGTSHLGDDDDGGIASALALLSSHVDAQVDGELRSHDEHVGGGNPSVSREETIAALDTLFALENASDPVESSSAVDVEKAVELLCEIAAAPNSRSLRSTICYTLNSKRSTSAEIYSLSQFDGVCKVFDAILRSYMSDDSGMANAKMLMMLAQTFFYLNTDSSENLSAVEASPSRPKREKRIYVRNRLTGHPIWSNDDFWDEAFRTAMAESLTVSGVMSNFERSKKMVHKSAEHGQAKGSMMRWFDLSYEERLGAASQVHAVICAQLGALAHSMIEFGCGLERSCAFVRRTAIRNQLPTSQRRMLLQHLIARHDAEQLNIPVLR